MHWCTERSRPAKPGGARMRVQRRTSPPTPGPSVLPTTEFWMLVLLHVGFWEWVSVLCNWTFFIYFQILECMCSTHCNPMDWGLPVSSVHGILQARILERVAMPSSRGSFWPSDQIHISSVSSIAGGFFTHWGTWEALNPCIHGQMTFDKEAKIFNRGEKHLFNKWCKEK